jgi:hypothetical protein
MTTDAAATPERSTGAARVLGTFVTLALFLGALFWLGQKLFVSPVDGAAKQREFFGEGALPFGLALDSAMRLPTGDTLVRFERPDAGRGPSEVLFLEYRSPAAVEALFRPSSMGDMEGGGAGARMKEWEREKAFDWHTTMKRDEVSWGNWSSKLLVERSFAKGGGWKEEARVNLSSPKRPLVLFAHWPAETPVDEKALRELLLAITLAPPAE